MVRHTDRPKGHVLCADTTAVPAHGGRSHLCRGNSDRRFQLAIPRRGRHHSWSRGLHLLTVVQRRWGLA